MTRDQKSAELMARGDGLRVVVTAGAGGVGRVISERFADRGARVVACDVDAEGAEQLGAARPDICVLQGDIGLEETVDAVFSEAERRFGGVDVLVNNVGIAGPTAAVEDISTEDWNHTLRTNLTSHF